MHIISIMFIRFMVKVLRLELICIALTTLVALRLELLSRQLFVGLRLGQLSWSL